MDPDSGLWGPATRTNTTLGTETFDYDDLLGHLTQIVNGAGTTNFTYEGTGQLSQVSGPNGNIDLYHDIDDGLTMRVHGDAVEYWFSGWQLDDNADSPREIEQILPMVQQVTDTESDAVSFRWIAREYDGHGLLTFDHDGGVVGAELLGAYGVPIAERPDDASLAANGFHGMEQDEGFPGTRMGSSRLSRSDVAAERRARRAGMCCRMGGGCRLSRCCGWDCRGPERQDRG